MALPLGCAQKHTQGPVAPSLADDAELSLETETIVVSAAVPSSAKPTGILRALQNGDRACYLVLVTDAGELNKEGDFDLCEGGPRDATSLLGKRVTWTTESAAVQSASCQGDPECTDSETIDIVSALIPLP